MRTLRTTTAICLAVSLAAPAPIVAQQANATPEALPFCGDADAPCVTDEGMLRVDLPEVAATLELCAEDGARPCMTEDGLVEAELESEAAMQFLNDPAVAESMAAQDEADETPTEEMAEEASPTDEAVEEALTEDAAQAEEVEEAPVEETVEAVEETPAEETVEAEAEAEEMTAEETAETRELQDALEEQQAEADPEAETEMAKEAVEAEAKTATEITEDTVEADAEVTAEAEAGVEDVIVVEEAPAAAAMAAEDDVVTSNDVTVETEEVTEETSRSASEDFTTAVNGEANATATSGGGGLSDFEKALVVGLGAVVVGSLLNNGDEVVSNSGDRVVLRDQSGELKVLKNDDALLRQPGSQVRTETFSDGSTRTIVEREDGTKIVTIRAADGRVVRRARQFADGTQVILFDDTQAADPVRVSELPKPERETIEVDVTDEDALRKALERTERREIDRRFSLRQVRQIKEVRMLAPEIDLDAVTFATGSAAIQPSQAEELAALGRAMHRIIKERPGEVFLIEGHTDAVGAASYNLALSDRRAETVALALSEYFDVPPENMITQGYGESDLRIPTEEAERLNRRATVRRITPLLRVASN